MVDKMVFEMVFFQVAMKVFVMENCSERMNSLKVAMTGAS